MVDFMADLMILTGGFLTIIFWITLIVLFVIEVRDNIKEGREVEDED